jgi:proteasome accessory factor B
VDPYGLVVRGGRWYLVGFDLDREEIRAFRLSRLSTDLRDDGEGTEPPEGFTATDHVQAGPWGPDQPRERARIQFDPRVAWLAAAGVHGAEIGPEAADGRIEVLVPLTEPSWVASWALSYGPDAEVLEPPELREETIRRLQAVVGDA